MGTEEFNLLEQHLQHTQVLQVEIKERLKRITEALPDSKNDFWSDVAMQAIKNELAAINYNQGQILEEMKLMKRPFNLLFPEEK